MKKVVIYTASAVSTGHVNILESFAHGVNTSGDMSLVTHDRHYFHRNEDINVFFGSWKDRPDIHHVVKRSIIESVNPFICIETPLLGRGRVTDLLEDRWFRVGVNGFLACTGYFNNKNKPGDRWEKIRQELNIELCPWRNNKDGPIVVALQLPGDASLQGANISKWAYETIAAIRKLSSRDIILRTPQLPREFDYEFIDRAVNIKNGKVTLQTGTKENLNTTIDHALFTASYSSGFGIESVVRGTPVYVERPSSFAYSFSTPLERIFVEPNKPDRTQWLYDLSYAQWSDQEILSGECWRHLKEYFKL